MASRAFISIRSPDRSRKAIFRGHRDRARQAVCARSSNAGSRRIFFVQETGLRNDAFGADKFGLKNLKTVHWNLGAPQLYQYSLAGGEAVLSADGALCADTGEFETARTTIRRRAAMIGFALT